MFLRVLFVLLMLAAGAGGYAWLAGRPVRPAPGVLAPEAPRQSAEAQAKPIRHRGYYLTPVARFEAEARVLGLKGYAREPLSELAPYDLAIGWGPLSDSAVLDGMTILQSDRVYRWRFEGEPLPAREVIRHSTNIHLIPSGAGVAGRVMRLKPGQVVRLSGRLVDVRANDGSRWETSTSRTDAGLGACEILWVERLEVVER